MNFRKFSTMAGLTVLLSAAAPYSALAAGPGGNLTAEEMARIRQNYGANQTNTEADTTPAQLPPPPPPAEIVAQREREQAQAPVPEPVQEQAVVAEQLAAPAIVVSPREAPAPQVVQQSTAEIPPLPAPVAAEPRSRLVIKAVPRNPQNVVENNYTLPISLGPIVRGYSFSGKSVGGFAMGYGGEAGLHLTENLRLTIAGGVLSRINDARYSGPSGTETTRTIGSEDELGYADQVLQTDRLRNTDTYDGFAEAAISYDLGTALIDKDFNLSLGLVAGVLTGQRDLETRTSQLLQTTRNGENVSSQQTAEAIQNASQGTHLSPTAQARLSLGYAPIGLEASFAAGVFDLSLAHPKQSRDLYTAELKLDLVKVIEAIAE